MEKNGRPAEAGTLFQPLKSKIGLSTPCAPHQSTLQSSLLVRRATNTISFTAQERLFLLCDCPDTQRHRRNHNPIATYFHSQPYCWTNLARITGIRASAGGCAICKAAIDVGTCRAIVECHCAHRTGIDWRNRCRRPVRDHLCQKGRVVGRITPTDLMLLAETSHIACAIPPIIVNPVVRISVWVCEDTAVKPKTREES